MSTKDEEVSQVPDQLMEQLLKGYDSLHAEFKLLNDQRRELEQKLAWATKQYSDVLRRFSPTTEQQESKTFLEGLEEAAACRQNGNIDWLDCVSKDDDPERRTRAFNIRVADDAREKLRTRQQEVQGVRIWSGRCADKRGSTSSKLRHELERDFTVPGTPSRLGCPFAVQAGGSVSIGQRSLPTPRSSASRASGSVSAARRRLSKPDPIQAEMCGNDRPMSPAISVEGSSAVCPIRFMDQHSPEEVAQYFEKHKHQIPRSHEVCIKRYQSNSESIRQLDAKYGNLVSMIQGLGHKHQPILAEKNVDEEVEEEPKKETVTKWAKDVTTSLQDEDVLAQEADEADERTPHFDRPLKEIRVGESPSRPWGITVPAKYQTAASVASEASAITASPQELSSPNLEDSADGAANSPTKPSKCPFDHGKMLQQPDNPAQARVTTSAQPAIIPISPEKPSKPAEATSDVPRMVFTGPVFIGYPVEQALQLLRESGLGAKT